MPVVMYDASPKLHVPFCIPRRPTGGVAGGWCSGRGVTTHRSRSGLRRCLGVAGPGHRVPRSRLCVLRPCRRRDVGTGALPLPHAGSWNCMYGRIGYLVFSPRLLTRLVEISRRANWLTWGGRVCLITFTGPTLCNVSISLGSRSARFRNRSVRGADRITGTEWAGWVYAAARSRRLLFHRHSAS
jgi:hypothetical protein